VTAATAARARDVRGVATRRGSPRRASKPPRVFLFLFLFFFFFFYYFLFIFKMFSFEFLCFSF
jgi:hypothetical protein